LLDKTFIFAVMEGKGKKREIILKKIKDFRQ